MNAIFLGLIIVLQIFILIGIRRTNDKLDELSSTLTPPVLSNSISLELIDENIKRITNIFSQLADTINTMVDKLKAK